MFEVGNYFLDCIRREDTASKRITQAKRVKPRVNRNSPGKATHGPTGRDLLEEIPAVLFGRRAGKSTHSSEPKREVCTAAFQ